MKRFDKGYVYSCLLSDLFTSLVATFILWKAFEEAGPPIEAGPLLVIGFFVIYLGLIGYRILYCRTSGYELTDREIRCKRGVLFQKSSVLEYRKIHAINKKQTLFQRIFGIAVLTVDSGSTNTSHEAEITIIEKAKTVDALTERLNTLKNGKIESEAEAKEELLLSEGDSLYRFTSKRKMLYTLIQIASTAFYMGILGAFLILVIASLGAWGRLLFSLLFLAVATLVASILSFVGCLIHSFVGYHDFSITRRGEDLCISYGLLERHTNTFSQKRIKAVKITQGLVQRMLGFATIKLEVIGYIQSDGNEEGEALGVLVPFCRYSEVGKILERILPDYVPDEKKTRSVAYLPYVSWFIFYLAVAVGVVLLQVLCPMLIFGASSTAIISAVLAILWEGAAVLAVKLIHAGLSFRNNGLCVKDGKITVYSGSFTRSITVLMAKSLIAAESQTTPLRQKKGITSIVMHLKTNALSNEIKVHIQRDSLAEELEGLLRY
ncbi:MAG: PH domain-containing protein [Clostridia bacterium]|nr:PH domain-containing protein [Clostridia bacterium]